MTKKRFALLGAAGFVAPRHMRAIHEIGGDLVACYDTTDSVGVIDRYFPGASFFTEFERFDRHVYKLQCSDRPIDYVAICSPNHLHDPHIRWALRMGCDAICEKPLVLSTANLDYVRTLEKETGRRTNAILQLRLHQVAKELHDSVDHRSNEITDVEIATITPRGKWYHYSWKGDVTKSGGLATNIGVHLFDLLGWVYGDALHSELHLSEASRCSGFIRFRHARVKWYLSIDADDLALVGQTDRKPYRAMRFGGVERAFDQGFEDLHTLSYRDILEGTGFGVEDARPALELVESMRAAAIQTPDDRAHPLLLKRLAASPGN